MKILVGTDMGSYSWDWGTITLTGIPDITIDNLLMVVDVTKNLILYNFADPTHPAEVTNGNTIDLDYNIDWVNANSDKLQIWLQIDPLPQVILSYDAAGVLINTEERIAGDLHKITELIYNDDGTLAGTAESKTYSNGVYGDMTIGSSFIILE